MKRSPVDSGGERREQDWAEGQAGLGHGHQASVSAAESSEAGMALEHNVTIHWRRLWGL